MGEKEPSTFEGIRERVRNKLGAKVGMRPTWFEQEVWDQKSPEERRLIRVMHDKGGSGFRILRSAEASIKNYKRP